MMHRFKGLGVTVEYVDGSVPASGPHASLMVMVHSMAAGEERRKLIERTTRGRKAGIAEGRFLGRPPYGYIKDAEKNLVADPGQAEVVRYIFGTYDIERVGLREIQKRLHGRFKAPDGGRFWHQGTIHRVLSADHYWSGKHYTGVPCPPVVSEGQGRRVQERLKANTRLKTGRKQPWPLQGRVRCSCGGAFRCQPARPGVPADYYCRNRYSDTPRAMTGERPCDVPRVQKEKLELLVLMTLQNALQDPVHLQAALEASVADLKLRLKEQEAEIGR